MPDLIITVAPEHVQLVRDMVAYRMNNPDLTDPEIIEYTVTILTQQLKRWCQEQQQATHNGTFTFNDPVP